VAQDPSNNEGDPGDGMPKEKGSAFGMTVLGSGDEHSSLPPSFGRASAGQEGQCTEIFTHTHTHHVVSASPLPTYHAPFHTLPRPETL
jgi:hypothetical protein